ncbi:hypothetical protein [Staphylococcus phage vB_SauH_DELF3]|nr:hypothetical protein [Staphylococcus phage vB_SauH_DELF3]
MCKEKVHRQLEDAIEILAYSIGRSSLPSRLSTTDIFRIINWKGTTLVFEVRDVGTNGTGCLVATPIADFCYEYIKITTRQYIRNSFPKLSWADMYTYYKLLGGQ